MALVADYSSSSTEESSSSEGESESESTRLPSLAELPGFSELRKRKLTTNSVYSNPFIHEREETLATLSKHTALTTVREETLEEKKFRKRQERMKKRQVEQVKLCTHFFKKGTCKYGESCKFLHALPKDEETSNEDGKSHNVQHSKDNNDINSYLVANKSTVSQTSKKKANKLSNINYIQNEIVPSSEADDTDDVLWEGGGNNIRKRRIGITDSVVPSKKAISAYEKLSKT